MVLSGLVGCVVRRSNWSCGAFSCAVLCIMLSTYYFIYAAKCLIEYQISFIVSSVLLCTLGSMSVWILCKLERMSARILYKLEHMSAWILCKLRSMYVWILCKLGCVSAWILCRLGHMSAWILCKLGSMSVWILCKLGSMTSWIQCILCLFVYNLCVFNNPIQCMLHFGHAHVLCIIVNVYVQILSILGCVSV